MRSLPGLRESILLAVQAGCAMGTPIASAGPARPELPTTGLDVASRDRCVAQHPRRDPLQALSRTGPAPIEAAATAARCRAELPAADSVAHATVTGDLARPEPTAAQAEALCDPSAWISLEAALCIADASHLPAGIEPRTAGLVVSDRLNTVVWTIDVITERQHDHFGGLAIGVDAVDGTVRTVSGFSVMGGRHWPARASAAAASGSAAAWVRAGLDEHASVAAFARHVLELLALGAPSALVDAAGRALRDEVRHAELSFAMAARSTGAPIAPGPLDTSAPARSTPEEVLVACALEGCLGETLAAAEARLAAARADDAQTRQVLTQIADDEARHAALAWRTLAWGLARFPETRDAVAAALLASRPRAATEDAWGILTPAERDRLAARVLRVVEGPAVRALAARGHLGARATVRPRATT